MIKPEDLRIGDLVRGRVSCDYIFPKGTMFAVFEINPLRYLFDKEGVVGLRAINNNDDRLWETCSRNVEGISVTPEILNKNGFKEEVVGDYFTKPIDNEEYSLVRYLAVERKFCNWAVFLEYRGLQDYVLLRKIQYVHELQHVLWVLGLDAELKIK